MYLKLEKMIDTGGGLHDVHHSRCQATSEYRNRRSYPK